MVDVRVRQRETFTREELTAVLRWLEAAYGDPRGSWRDQHWEDLGPGPHLVVEERGELLAHACIAWIPVQVGERSLRAGYVEDVATHEDVRGRGLATAILEAARPLLEDGSELGLLSTGAHAFYERLGWVCWKGPSSVSETDGSITPTPEEDGGIMALFVPRSPSGIATDMPIRRPRRDPIEPW